MLINIVISVVYNWINSCAELYGDPLKEINGKGELGKFV